MQSLIAYLLEPISYLISAGALLFWTTRDKRSIIKIVIFYYIASSILIFMANEVKGRTNIPFYTLLCVLTSFSLGSYFFTILNRKWQKGIAVVACLINGGYYVTNNLIKSSPVVFDSLAYVILSATIVVFIFMFMHQLLSEVKVEPLSLNFDFWFVSAQLFYFLGAFIIFLTFGFLTSRVLSNNERVSLALMWLWGFHNVLLLLSSLITTGSIVWISLRSK